jgi:hypothetical protein
MHPGESAALLASTWGTISQVATTIGAILAAGTLGAGFLLYRLNRRDDDIAALRMTIATSRANADRLRGLVGYELGDELVTAAVYSRSMLVPLKRILDTVFLGDGELTGDVKEQIHERLGVITVAIDSSIAREYEDTVRELLSDSARYQTSYPGLYRVLRSLAILYGNVLEMEKGVARDERAWANEISILLEDERENITNLDQLKYHLSSRLIRGSAYLASEARKELGDLGEILDLVTDGYLAHDEASLVRLSRKERGETIKPLSNTKTITEDLREAEKALQHMLSRDELLKYREIVTRFDSRRESDAH